VGPCSGQWSRFSYVFPGSNLKFRHCSALSFQKISVTKQGCTVGGSGGTIPLALNDSEGQKVPTKSQLLFSIQQTSFRKTSVSKIGAPNLLLAPGTI